MCRRKCATGNECATGNVVAQGQLTNPTDNIWTVTGNLNIAVQVIHTAVLTIKRKL